MKEKWYEKALRAWFGIPKDQPVLRNFYQYRFERYRLAREQAYGPGLSSWRCPSRKGLVSVVLPVFNGEKLIREALDSILCQTYGNFELIAVDDGSTDETPAILDAYAARDSRIRVVHQENQKLPRSLSNGFRLARGEFLTWTSDDNRLKPRFLERMVDCLQRHPHWDMAYADIDIIGEDGELLKDSEWYKHYQRPPGSGHVHFPRDISELNIWPNQYVGAGFMYRDRVDCLLGDYSPHRFTVEDYDYFMRVNEFFTLRHVDFEDTVYEYRFHGTSLTSREKELDILGHRDSLMVFDDFRRDFNLTPVYWILESDGSAASRDAEAAFREKARKAGDLTASRMDLDAALLPRLFFPAAYVRFWGEGAAPPPPPPEESIPPGSLRVLVAASAAGSLPSGVPSGWDLCVALEGPDNLPVLGSRRRGWFSASRMDDLLLGAEIRTRSSVFEAVEKEIFAPPVQPELRFSIVICTYKRSKILVKALESAAGQDYDPSRFEVILVNNAPSEDLSGVARQVEERFFKGGPGRVRYVLCPIKGLSSARNAGISEARGEVVCFLDDDAVASPRWLKELERAYEDEKAGVVGGKIILQVPESARSWVEPAIYPYWSHFEPGFKEIHWAEDWPEYPWGANWTARRIALLRVGGFRASYGRKGKDFSGGEEQVAAILAARLGYKVGLIPEGEVLHFVEESRFTKKHLKKTVQAGRLVNYRFQRDLYVPRWMTPGFQLKQIKNLAKKLVRSKRIPPTERMLLRFLLSAEVRVLRTILWDIWKRVSLPRRLD